MLSHIVKILLWHSCLKYKSSHCECLEFNFHLTLKMFNHILHISIFTSHRLCWVNGHIVKIPLLTFVFEVWIFSLWIFRVFLSMLYWLCWISLLIFHCWHLCFKCESSHCKWLESSFIVTLIMLSYIVDIPIDSKCHC